MDFFTAQTRARVKTRRLVFLFILAILGVSLGVYAALMLALNGVHHREAVNAPSAALTPDAFWNPDIALGTFVVVALFIGFGSLFKWATLRAGGPAVAEMMGGRRVSPGTLRPAERRLVNVVEEMALAAGVPVPQIYILDAEGSINAFAAGLTTGDAVVAVSRGALEQLPRDELQAVIGHEFSHILNGDMRLNLKLTAIIFGILALAIIGRILLQSSGGRRSSNSKNNNILPLVGLGFILAGYLGYFFGRLIQAAVSRQREFLADASSVQFTRNPLAMANALNRIRAGSSVIENPRAGEISHFFFAQSFSGCFASLFATHPPLPERIKAVAPDYNFAGSENGTNRFGMRRQSGERAAPPLSDADATFGEFEDAGKAVSAVAIAPNATRTISARPLPPRSTSAANVSHLTSSIGTLTSENIRYAEDLHAHIPAPLLAAAHDPAQAAWVIFGLLLETTNPQVLQQQSALLDLGSFDSDLLHDLTTIAPHLRLPLLQITLGTLPAFTPAQQDQIVSLAEKLAGADGRITIFEYALLRLLKHHVANLRNPRRAAATHPVSKSEFSENASVVLSFIAYAGHSPRLPAPAAFAAGIRALPGLSLRLLPDKECHFRRLDAALTRLAGIPPSQKQPLLTAAAQTAAADGVIEPAEAELLRAIACSLDCPMPPLG